MAKQMKESGLAWGITWRVTLWGLGGGVGLGAIYGPLSMTIGAFLILLGYPVGGSVQAGMVPAWLTASFLAGAALGGLIGLPVGVVDGLLLAVIAGQIVRSPHVAPRYRRTLSVTSAVVGGLAAFVLFMGLARRSPHIREMLDWAGYR